MKYNNPINPTFMSGDNVSTVYKCPMCGEFLHYCVGSKLNPSGITIYCVNKVNCEQEVMGFGANVEKAYQIVVDKFKFK
jgi:hypothetical protein